MDLSTSWSANDYKNVAEKHYQTCRFLKLSLTTAVDDVKKNILFDLYYLSGYVIECLLKYHILIHKHHCSLDAQIDKGTLSNPPYKLIDHRLSVLATKANEGEDGIDISYDSRSDLFKSWSEQVRYEANISLVEGEIIAYFEQDITVIRTTILSAS